MAILLSRKNRVVVQGITGDQGAFHTRLMLDYGTRIIAGVTPGKGGTELHDVKVYDTILEASSEHDFDTSILFVPAPFAKEAALEAINSGIQLIVIITENMPIKDSIELMEKAKRAGVRVLGPNTPGIITPGESKVGVMPAPMFKPGIVGMISRSGTLTYEIAWKISKCGFGQSTCVGIGGDPVIGFNIIDALKLFERDNQTKVVVLIGEIGGNAEELAVHYIKRNGYTKPIIAFVAGRSAPPEKRMGHAGAIVFGSRGTARSKIEAFASVGINVAIKPGDVAGILSDVL